MITSIYRDWGSNPSIVRLVADDAYSVVVGSSYIADQEANIQSANFGNFEWKDNDVVLASLSDGEVFLQAAVASDGTVTLSAASSSQSIVTYLKVNDDGAASDATAETPVFTPSSGAVISSVSYTPNAALTADNTNYATLTVANRDASGSAVGDIAAITTEITGTGNWVAFVEEDFGDLSNSVIEENGSVTFEIEKAGTGVVVPAGVLTVEYVII